MCTAASRPGTAGVNSVKATDLPSLTLVSYNFMYTERQIYKKMANGSSDNFMYTERQIYKKMANGSSDVDNDPVAHCSAT